MSSPAPAPAATPQASWPLVLVDDEPGVLSALRRVLSRTRFELHDFSSPKAALAFLARSEVHVVVADYAMPEMDGVAFLGQARTLRPLAQRVMLTGLAEPWVLEDAVNRSEVFRFISKPWDDRALVRILESAAAEYQARAENVRLQQLLQVQNEELKELLHDVEGKAHARGVALAALETTWARSLDAMEDPLVVIGPAGEVRRANRTFAQRLRAIPPLGLDLPALVAGTSTGAPPATVAAAGSLWRVRVFPTGEGEAVLAFRDVTDEEYVSRRVRSDEKMMALGQLAGGVAHEINSPLAGILTYAQLLAREPGRSDADREALDLIEAAARRAARIVESLVRLARPGSGAEAVEVDVGALVEDVLVLFSPQIKGSRCELRRELAPGLLIGGRPDELQQVLLHLLRNARQAIGERAGTIGVRASVDDGRVRLEVSDTGPGVEAAHLHRIFEPFFTTRPDGEGHGLGLAICHRLVEGHGGRIEVDSAPGRGATFRVTLPALRGTDGGTP